MKTKLFLSACMTLTLTACNQLELPRAQPSKEVPAPASAPAQQASTIPAQSMPSLLATSAPIETKAAPKAELAKEDAELRLMVPLVNQPMIFLGDAANDLAAVPGSFSWISRKDSYYAIKREVDLSKLPETTAAWMGQEVKLFNRDGSSCETEVTGLYMLAQMYAYNEETQGLSAPQLFKEAQDLSGLSIVAQVKENTCKDAIFARAANLSEPMMAEPKAAPTELADAVLPKMRALATYKSAQKDYKDFKTYAPSKIKTWEEYGGGASIYTVESKTKRFALASIRSFGGCGDFDSALFAVWEVGADQSLTLVYEGSEFLKPDFALDLDGDEVFEFYQEGVWKLQSGSYQSTQEIIVPSEEEGCGC